jgi:hypothetical protein
MTQTIFFNPAMLFMGSSECQNGPIRQHKFTVSFIDVCFLAGYKLTSGVIVEL